MASIPDEKLMREGLHSIGRSFYGTIPEYIKDVPMARGFANLDENDLPLPFDIETACYSKPVFQAIQDPDIPVVACLAAVQMLKTFICCEAAPAYFIEHDPGDTTIYIGGDDSARDQSRARTLPWWWSIPGISKLFSAAESNDRFDINTQEFFLPGQVLRIWGMNENTTARITLRRVIGSDIYLSKNTGLWLQAMARTTQHKRRKIIGESQGGEKGDDMDKFWETTDMGYLHVTCPLCGKFQPFDFHRERPDEFVAAPPKTIPSLDHAAWITHHTPILLKPENRHTGFKRGDEDLIKRADGSYNEAEILKQTYYECYHCGGAWHDTPATRRALDQSSDYVPSNPNALPGYKGFSWPSWAGQRLPWGGEHVMLGYLRAKQRQEKYGNKEDLKQWWQKRAAKPWDEKLARELRRRLQESFDVEMSRHDAWRLCMIVDNQLHLMQQWAMVLAVKKDGSVRQIWRGSLNGLAEVRKKQLEYVDASGNQILKDWFVFLDSRYKPEQIRQHIIEYKYGRWITWKGERTWNGWMLMQGSRFEYQTHSDEKDKTKKFVVGDPNYHEGRVDGKYVELLTYPFSATACGERFEASRDGLGMETLFLPRQKDEPPDEHELSHHSQIHSNKLVESKSVVPRESRMRYVPVPASAPDHYFHMWRMFEGVKEIWGIDGVYHAAATAPEKAKG